ncbi:hypothetical protein KZO01_14070 [Kurthia zopfii]|uniref:Protein of uncharacterized function n=1 Tax=Kurthia zopfii TaxID=1650 RepID=A0A8B4QCS5_9BACL|nr:DUF1835 domain-containing protein [Kurthia zopfii]PWI23667.1 hypothetical protein DF281_02205 [Kurthia zopfii]TDR42647.1 uncharacterized protein DUF1835 [Kurthia zopfii]GEK31098.1 hypothetical protein KZO01_14070 [Kurthia zopfii]STX10516.1 Protein of uncharacterised function [Kurthia zopfii]
MFTEIRSILNSISEKDAKVLLQYIFMEMKSVEENKIDASAFFEDVKETYGDLIRSVESQQIEATECSSTHIVFGVSTSGSLKMAIQENVICFDDIFSIAPITELHEAKGIAKRHEWLDGHLNMEDEESFSYEKNCMNNIEKLSTIPATHPIYIWAGENAHEQTALMFILDQLKHHSNEIIWVNPNKLYDVRYTGEVYSEQLNTLLKDENSQTLLSKDVLHEFEKQWEKLTENESMLRIWEDGKVKTVQVSYFDEFILEMVKEAGGEGDFILAARAVGEVIGNLEQYIGDRFIEYRIIQLALSGKLALQGVPKGMRYFKVKTK